MSQPPPVVPEFDVSELDRSIAIYCDVLGFRVAFTRPEERLAYLVREGAHLMLEEAAGPGRRFHVAPLEHPFGRGLNLQIAVADAASLYAVVEHSELRVIIPLEQRWYRQDRTEIGQLQFVVADPDGYLLRFSQGLGRRPSEGMSLDAGLPKAASAGDAERNSEKD